MTLLDAELRARRDHALSPLELAVWSLASGDPDVAPDAVHEEIERRVAASDPERPVADVDALLATHLRRARARSEIFNSFRAVVSLDAIGEIVAAHRRGVAVEVATRYRAAWVPLLAIYVLEWDGEPLARGTKLDLPTDLVAGPWLRRLGVPIAGPPPDAGAPRRRKRPATRKATVDGAVAAEALADRLDRGLGSPWHLTSWALMLGRPGEGRARLRAAADDARARWSADRQPNHNVVREHFAYALVLGDGRALDDTIAALRAWMRAAAPAQPRYAHASGYLDVVADLLAGDDVRDVEADRAAGPLPSVRVATLGLVARNASRFNAGLDAVLAEHARVLERKSSPPPPVCESAACLAAAAHRLGIEVDVDPAWRAHGVPVEGGRLPCDLLGRDLALPSPTDR